MERFCFRVGLRMRQPGEDRLEPIEIGRREQGTGAPVDAVDDDRAPVGSVVIRMDPIRRVDPLEVRLGDEETMGDEALVRTRGGCEHGP